MNYYEHHLGDYAEATAHLSFVEDAAYSRLIRKYYASEKPIPADIAAAQRLVGARSKEERAAVETVLNEFFVLQDDGWHQVRCDAEIARYQDKQDKAKRSANARWNKADAHTERNANAMRTHSEGNALQTPDTRHQTPEEKRTPRAARTASPKKSPIPDGFTISDRVAEWASSNGHGHLTRHLEHFRSACKAKGYTYADWDEAFMGAIRKDWAGLNVPQARASPNRPQSAFDRNAEIIASLTGRQSQQSRKDIIDVTPPQPVPPRMGPAHLLPPDRHVRCAENGDDMGAD